jgi:hypothetical protein
VGSVFPRVSSILPPVCPSYVGIFSFLYVAPLVIFARSFYCVTGLGIVFFFVSTLPLFVSLVFASGLPLLCDELASISCLSFVGYLDFGFFTGTFYSSFQSFIAHRNSSTVTHYLIYNHSFSRSLLARSTYCVMIL